MIGREHELEPLTEILSRTGKGEGGLLPLAGEAGVGKTRLAEVVAARAAAALATRILALGLVLALRPDRGGNDNP